MLLHQLSPGTQFVGLRVLVLCAAGDEKAALLCRDATGYVQIERDASITHGLKDQCWYLLSGEEAVTAA